MLLLYSLNLGNSFPWMTAPVANARDTAQEFAPLRAFGATFANAGIAPASMVADVSDAPVNSCVEPAPVRTANAS